MNEQNTNRIREAMRQLDEATDGIQGLSVFALAMPHGSRGQMQVQILSKGSDTQVAHKLYECMRYDSQLPFSLMNIIMTSAAKFLAEQPEEATQAFLRTVEKCRKNWSDVQQIKAVIDDCRQVIDEATGQDVTEELKEAQDYGHR